MQFKKIIYESLTSTNDEAIRLISADVLKEPAVIISDIQTKGRGRGSHTWTSSHSGNIYSSYCIPVGDNVRELPQLTLISALAVADGINAALKQYELSYELSIKWPNDLLLNGKKIVGILTELAQDKSGCYYAVIGIGTNVDWSREDIELVGLPYAGSICDILGISLKKHILQEHLEQSLADMLDKFLAGSRFADYKAKYDAYLINIGKKVIYTSDNIPKTGLCLGVDEQGYLLIEYDGGQDRINFGEINIEGIYGY